MKQTKLTLSIVATTLFVFLLSPMADAQGFGIGTPNPTEILHLLKNGDAAVRFQGQTSGGGATDGPQSPTVGASAGGGSVAWTSPTNIYLNDGVNYATATTGVSQYLKATGFNFSGIPVGASIDGIEVTVDRSRNDITYVAPLSAWTFDDDPSFTLDAGTGTNRLVVLFVGTIEASAYQTVSSVTFGTQSMISAGMVAQNNGDGEWVNFEVWYLPETLIAAAGTGVQTVTVNGTGGSDSQLFAIASFQNVDQTNPISDTEPRSATTTNPLSFSSALSCVKGDLVLAGALASDDTNSNLDNDNTDDNFDNTPAGYTEVGDISDDQGGNDEDELAMSIVQKADIPATQTENPAFDYQPTADDDPTNFLIEGIVLHSVRTVYDTEVKLIKADGTVAGSNKAATSTDWPAADASVTYGSSTDIWGLSWTDTDVKDADFGVALSVTANNATANVDHVTVKIYYTPSGNYTNFAIGIDQSASGNFVISNNASLGTNDRIIIDAAGKVGIGRVPSANMFEVEGDASKTTATAWLANSDKKIKTDIKDIESAIETIKLLRPVTFKYTNEYKLKHPSVKSYNYYNVIAQEFKNVFPDFVKDDGEGLLQVDTYPALIVAIAAIKEQQKIIDGLKLKLEETSARAAKCDALEIRILKIEDMLNTLKNVSVEAKK
ncbi:MAG: tail fiber domain-containing protein [Bacteroidetes bacterium]|nr:tail fiber domain-containing protein [Bacteroidota bacterium]